MIWMCDNLFTFNLKKKIKKNINSLMNKWLQNAVTGDVYTWGWKECVPSGKVIGDPSTGLNTEKESLTLTDQGIALWSLGQ